MCYMTPLVCAWEYYPERKGLITGLILSAYGGSSFAFGFVSTWLCNPEDLKPTIPGDQITFFGPEVADRFPMMLRTLVYIWTAFTAVGVLLLSRKEPEETPESLIESHVESEKVNITDIIEDTPQEELDVPEEYELKSLKYVFYSIPFWQLSAIIMCGNYFPGIFGYTIKAFGEDGTYHKQISDHFLTIACSVGSGGVNGAVRILMGWLNDKYSFKLLLTILLSLMLANACTCFWAAKFPPAYFVCVLLNYFCVGGLWTIFPQTIINVYGQNKGPVVYSLIMASSFLTALAELITTKYILPVTTYLVLYSIGGCFVAVGLLVLCFYKEKLDVENLKRHNGVIVKVKTEVTSITEKEIDCTDD